MTGPVGVTSPYLTSHTSHRRKEHINYGTHLFPTQDRPYENVKTENSERWGVCDTEDSVL